MTWKLSESTWRILPEVSQQLTASSVAKSTYSESQGCRIKSHYGQRAVWENKDVFFLAIYILKAGFWKLSRWREMISLIPASNSIYQWTIELTSWSWFFQTKVSPKASWTKLSKMCLHARDHDVQVAAIFLSLYHEILQLSPSYSTIPSTHNQESSDQQTNCLHACEPPREHMKDAAASHLQRAFVYSSIFSPCPCGLLLRTVGGWEPEVS